MTLPSKNEFELGLRILESLEGQIDKNAFAELDDLIRHNLQAADLYLDQVLNHAILMWQGGMRLACAAEAQDIQFLSEMGEYEKSAPRVEISAPATSLETMPYSKPVKAVRPINKVSLVTAVTSLAALLFLLLYVHISPPKAQELAAVLKDSVGAVWGDEHAGSEASEMKFFADSKPWELQKGYARIAYEYGTEVTIEGPAVFSVLGPEEMLLQSGKIYARSPSSSIGFTVLTPNSKVIDLGTEFGIRVDQAGTTDVHMIKGKASLIAGQKGDTKSNEIMQSGIAKQVGADEQVRAIGLQENLFARQISSETGAVWYGQDLNLADAVSGSKGFGSGICGRGISLSSGRAADYDSTSLQGAGSGAYTLVIDSPLVDGIFVPDGDSGLPVIVSSSGDIFARCPATSGQCAAGIYAGRSVRGSMNGYYGLILDANGSAADSASICMWGNAGITFDLDAIRRMIPACRILSFGAVCGLSVSEPSGALISGRTLANVYVLVDGKVRYDALGLSRYSEHRTIGVELDPDDRFLTLVATDDGQLSSDWLLFTEPILKLALEN